MKYLKFGLGLSGGVIGFALSILIFIATKYENLWTLLAICVITSIISIIFSCLYLRELKICSIILIMCSIPLFIVQHYLLYIPATLMLISGLLFKRKIKVIDENPYKL